MSAILFITHPEVVIDPKVPITQWPLSEKGRARMAAFAAAPVLAKVRALYASTERKATDGAAILAERLALPVETDHALGENDRSATGYIAPPEFWEVVHAFFSRPRESVRGWERAADAQGRIVEAVRRIAHDRPIAGDIAMVSHGAVGSLLLAHLDGAEDARSFAQPHEGGGCFFVLDRERFTLRQGWRLLEDAVAMRA
jgi:broad specificity phosphatase PhoE